MDKSAQTIDWSLVPAFLAVAETGSLSAAARRLATSQPTVGRQIAQLEETLGTPLFTRHPRGLTLNEAGHGILSAAQSMQDGARALSLGAAGHTQTLRGSVRITASAVVSQFILPPIIAEMRQAEPEITIDLVPSDGAENLLFREADIAIRMFRSTQLDIVTRHLGDLPIVICAARDYLKRRGRPGDLDDLMRHDMVGYDHSDLILRGMRDAGIPAQRDWFHVRCDDQPTYIALIRAGCGIGFVQRNMVKADPTLEEIDLGVAIPVLPVWLAAPQSTRNTPRIARIWEMLESALEPLLS